ncbi:MAG: hypothetical protein V5B40_23765 [Candidatus Accumulibacter meliphilus]|jgi:hypothetical protein|uniref:hypothetical protein n=1 Tax=Candidatus Accumulibacter meliphilus TaxID=2211374 RepID=UPI002FC30C4E
MNVVVIIAGREAIPVRAIPHVTRRTITPDTLCKFLGHEDVLKRLLEVSVYSIQPPDGFAPYPPTAWDAISDSLQDLSTNLKAKENSGRTTRQDWRQQSPLKLPAGVFVWRDEFEPVYRRQWKGVFDDRARERLDEGLAERAGERDLYLDCTSAERDVFVEGFESVLLTSSPDSETGASTTEKEQPEALPADEADQQEPAGAAHSVVIENADLPARGADDTKQADNLVVRETVSKPPLQQRFQEEEILRVISELDHTATKLPRYTPGKPGVKAGVREKLGFTVTVFDKAWDRLRKDGRVKEAG